MSKIITTLLGATLAVLMAIIGWWVNRVNNTMDVVVQLQFKDVYLNGKVAAAPVEPLDQNAKLKVLQEAAMRK